MFSWRSVVGKLWMTIIGLVALVLVILGFFLIKYIDMNFANSKDVKNLFIYTAIIGFLLTTFFALFLLTRITRPLLELKKAAVAISKGDFEAKVEIYSADEIGQLGKAFNIMARQLSETITDLKHEKEHLRSMLRSMSDAVITFDATGWIVLVNPPGERLLRAWGTITWDEKVSEDADVMIRKVPEPLRELYDAVVGGAKELTSHIHLRNGVWSVVMTPLYTQDHVRGTVAVLRDVTEEHRLDKLREDFVANVSHELRTPLSMLQGYSEALIDDIVVTPEERRELTQIILDESLRMSRLVKNLLDLATMEAGHPQLNIQDAKVSNIIQRVIRKFSGVFREQHIHFIHEGLEEDVTILCDEDRIEQVLTNLISNALRHTAEHKSIMVRERVVTLQGKSFLHVAIEDEGTGIQAEDLEYVFERFYKADKARTRGESVGNGLGLAIVKNIIESHGGSVHVQSTYGKGSIFSFNLPIISNDKAVEE